MTITSSNFLTLSHDSILRRRENLCLNNMHVTHTHSLCHSVTVQCLTVVWRIITERQSKLFLFCQNKTRFNTLLHSVRRQSINKLYNYGLILRQTTIVFASLFLWDWKHNYVLYQGDKRERMKGTLSYLADDKKNDNKHTHRHMHTPYTCAN